MIRRALAAVGAAGLLLAAAVELAPTGGRAAASPVTSCSSSSKGTIMAVDYHHWGGPIVRGCDLKSPAHGNNLFDDLGFTHVGTAHDGPAFICRIGNAAWNGGRQYPTASDEPCTATPPASAYWSYWLAPAGQNHWSYSQLGAYSEVPKKGEVELWIFGGTDIKGSQGDPVNGFPTCTPNSLRAGGSPTSCTPSGHYGTKSTKYGQSAAASHHSTTRKDSGGHHAAAHPPPHTPSLPAARPSPSATASSSARASSSASASTRPSSSAPSSTAASSSSGSSSAVAVDAKPASDVKTSSGSTVPLVVGLSLAAVLAAGGGFTMWRRRRTD